MGSPAIYVLILLVLTVFFVVIPFLIYRVRKPHWVDPENDFAPFTWQAENTHPGIVSTSATDTSTAVATQTKGADS